MPRTRTRIDIDLPDLTGRRALITGGSDGLGLEIARRLALAGAALVLPVRDQVKGAAAAARIRSDAPGASVSVRALDLASLASVERLAEEQLAEGRPLDLLVNNAGVMTPPARHETEDGFELQLATNHLGHFALAGRLLPLLRAAHGRVTTQSSVAAGHNAVHWDDLQWERSYDTNRAYSSSKIAGSLFGLQLDRLSRARGWGISSTLAHPGISATNLLASRPEIGRDGDGLPVRIIRRMAASRLPLAQTAEEGALPALLAATDPAIAGGAFVGPRGPGHLAGAPARQRPYKQIAGEADAERMWAISEELTGVRWAA